MYFKKLELVGFKSFLDKTTLHFEPGITAIVGPNGCGKSNIFDSIRWVLGEQSAKSLRGSDMQDVIFNGTDTKEALGMAEVTLTFDNKQRFFNVEHDEVAITRRLFRSGESEYLLNKAAVRLKDILDLLMGTGIGSESYSIVAQGKIDLVLSSRPEDRRLVFDEASGITKYKSQKREATRKLDETEQNLLRVNDIVTEVKRQISSLERQANKARRYKETFEELKTKDINLAVIQKDSLLKEKAQIVSELEQLKLKESELLGAIKEEELGISKQQAELRSLEDDSRRQKEQLLNCENQVVRNNEHIKFNQERIAELEKNKVYLGEQIQQARSRIVADETSLAKIKEEFAGLSQDIKTKEELLAEKQSRINNFASSIKESLDSISGSKKELLDLAVRISNLKNDISDFTAKQQVYLARNKRLQIEKAKVFQERNIAEDALNNITTQVDELKKITEELSQKISAVKTQIEKEGQDLSAIDLDMANLEKQKLALESHRQFLEELKTKYDDIDVSLNAVIYLDRAPKERLSGLVMKIKDFSELSDEDKAYFEPANCKLTAEAKPIELDTQKIDAKINALIGDLNGLKDKKAGKESAIAGLSQDIGGLQQDFHNQEIVLANKQTSRQTILEQFNKIKEEEDLIVMELQDLEREMSVVENNLSGCQQALSGVNGRQVQEEDNIRRQEESILQNSALREELLIAITQIKTELEALDKKQHSDGTTLRVAEEAYAQSKNNLENLERQAQESADKGRSMEEEIGSCRAKIVESDKLILEHKALLEELEARWGEISDGSSGVVNKINSDRAELDDIKNRLYQFQMQDKDTDYKCESIKTRILQSYKIEIDVFEASLDTQDMGLLSEEIKALREKLDSYGSVNLVAIEEYDELKKRYDFLVQQQNDLSSAKESLHEAILKINRTTKKMFLETFEKVKVEFRNYFRMLFNGGDAQVFLVDEQDPLESGIEIICRPPGKKLQNVLLLSGGEKSMSAIALIFAIFKVKPSPFCVLDEIDAALDEANVDRFARALQEFSVQSQFIVVTHNRKTIANASVMYGITMQESGVSKIVSVKFSGDKVEKKQVEAALPEAV
ncbi:MAG: AAA family ATPase [Candidatus Omnitrophica bacterium]|nr:AAA family ATPase [Candidatus Omnitrophota bacterium]